MTPPRTPSPWCNHHKCNSNCDCMYRRLASCLQRRPHRRRRRSPAGAQGGTLAEVWRGVCGPWAHGAGPLSHTSSSSSTSGCCAAGLVASAAWLVCNSGHGGSHSHGSCPEGASDSEHGRAEYKKVKDKAVVPLIRFWAGMLAGPSAAVGSWPPRDRATTVPRVCKGGGALWLRGLFYLNQHCIDERPDV